MESKAYKSTPKYNWLKKDELEKKIDARLSEKARKEKYQWMRENGKLPKPILKKK